jgi:GNAT superfamily N-acetyltransferase
MSITFTSFCNPNWEDKINLELKTHLESFTNQHIPKMQGIYCFYETQHIGGALFQNHGKALWLDSLFIAPSFRRQGIGKMLIDEISVYAKQHNLICIQLNTYFEEAKSFFVSCDFEEIASIPNWKYGLTCFLMKKNI